MVVKKRQWMLLAITFSAGLLLLAGGILIAVKLLLSPGNASGTAAAAYASGDSTIAIDKKDSSPFDLEYQQAIQSQLDALKSQTEFTLSSPLAVTDPFGTNTLSVYLYFQSDEPGFLTYTITSEEAPDFTRTAYCAQENGTTEHEYQLIGLTPGCTNAILLQLINADGTVIEQAELTVDAPDLLTEAAEKLDKTETGSSGMLADGLYFMLGSDNISATPVYDNDGYIRSEIILDSYRTDRIEFRDGQMFYPVRDDCIAAVSRLGKAEALYELPGYEMHHDFVLDDSGDLLILVSKDGEDTSEDRILRCSTADGTVTELVDFGELLPDYVAACSSESTPMDWLHLNSIDTTDDGGLILSSRESSTIIKLADYQSEPRIEYLIADESIWDGFSYSSLLLDKKGDFSSNAGQHCAIFQADESLPDGQYYLTLYNNNYGAMTTRPSYDWSNIPGVGGAEGEASMAYKYLVDENAGTYELVWSKEVVYSSIVSSTQELDNGNFVINSGKAQQWQECSADGETIAVFPYHVNSWCYRVFKFTLDGFWFQ